MGGVVRKMAAKGFEERERIGTFDDASASLPRYLAALSQLVPFAKDAAVLCRRGG